MKRYILKIKRYNLFTVIINDTFINKSTRKTNRIEQFRKVKTEKTKRQLLKDCLYSIMDGIEQLEYNYKWVKQKDTIIEYHNNLIIYRKITIK